VINQEPRSSNLRKWWVTFIIVLMVGTAVSVANNIVLQGAPFSFEMAGAIFFLLVPPVAFVISSPYARVPEIRRYMKSLVRLPSAGIGWLVIALVFVPGLVIVANLIAGWSGRMPASISSVSRAGVPLIGLIAIKFLYQLLFYNVTGEEIGWSGFARRRLQATVSPLMTGLIVAFFWAPWHLFLWYGEGRDIFSWLFWLDSYINVLPASIIIGWIYNRSKGSILAAGMAHAAANTVFYFVPELDWLVYNLTVFAAAIVLIIADSMWQSLPADHPAVYASSSTGNSQPAELKPMAGADIS
jgi:membrane protease YdiL (CAAX protease family)